MRLRFWLLVMDLVEWLHLGQRLYLWALSHASNATDWGQS